MALRLRAALGDPAPWHLPHPITAQQPQALCSGACHKAWPFLYPPISPHAGWGEGGGGAGMGAGAGVGGRELRSGPWAGFAHSPGRPTTTPLSTCALRAWRWVCFL